MDYVLQTDSLTKHYRKFQALDGLTMPSTVDCVIPQVFQGMSTEVTVAASSVVRLKRRDSKPCRRKVSLYMSAARTMEMNWSPVERLRKRHVPTVEETRLKQLFAIRMMTWVMLVIIRLATIAEPKNMAQRMSHIVLSIPAIPPVETSSLSEALPVSMAVEP